jgi:RNA polymerase sigma-70 factor (ECF subfamily)
MYPPGAALAIQGVSIPNVSPALEKLYWDHNQLVYQAALRVTGRPNDAEDVMQTVFLRLLRRPELLSDIEKPEPYLRRAAVNAALDLLRERSSAPLLVDQEKAGSATHDSPELRGRLRQALARLKPAWAELFILKYLEGYSNNEIAAQLGMSSVGVAVSLFRIRQQLRKEI